MTNSENSFQPVIGTPVESNDHPKGGQVISTSGATASNVEGIQTGKPLRYIGDDNPELAAALAHLDFDVLHQPLGIPEEHMKAMKNNKEQYPTLEVYGELDKNGKMTDPNYIANDKVPQITQYRIRDDAELQRYITDKAEVARIQAEVQNGGKYPLLSHLNPLACQIYAEHMGMELMTDNEQSRLFLNALPGETIEEKFTNAGLPFPGCFDADVKQGYIYSKFAYWVSSAPHDGGFRSLWLLPGNRDAVDDGIKFDGSSPLLRKDKKVSA